MKKIICDLCKEKELQKYIHHKYEYGCSACPIIDTPEPTKEGLAKLASLAGEGIRQYKFQAERLEGLQAQLLLMAK